MMVLTMIATVGAAEYSDTLGGTGWGYHCEESSSSCSWVQAFVIDVTVPVDIESIESNLISNHISPATVKIAVWEAVDTSEFEPLYEQEISYDAPDGAWIDSGVLGWSLQAGQRYAIGVWWDDRTWGLASGYWDRTDPMFGTLWGYCSGTQQFNDLSCREGYPSWNFIIHYDAQDNDGDGVDVLRDCDDSSAAVNPDEDEIWYDGVDQDCDGNDDDQDLDGVAGVEAGGEDCDDLDPEINPTQAEVWYDGVDQNCDGNDADQDRDGHDAAEAGGDDCDDRTGQISPSQEEDWYDGVDQNCDGNDSDADGDGHDAEEVGGDDCDDLDPKVHPGKVDIRHEGNDRNCNGRDGVRPGWICSTVGGGSSSLLLAWFGMALLRRRRERGAHGAKPSAG